MMNGVGHGWGMGWGWIIGIVVLLVVIWVFIRAINQTGKRDEPERKSPLDVLKDRYARGDISREVFEEKKRDIRQ
jgi:putative membrane protein